MMAEELYDTSTTTAPQELVGGRWFFALPSSNAGSNPCSETSTQTVAAGRATSLPDSLRHATFPSQCTRQ